MTKESVLTRLVSLPYAAARLPLDALDQRLSPLLGEESAPARVAVARAFGHADQFAGSVLHNRTLAERGTERLKRTDQVLDAVRLEAEAAKLREQADRTRTAGAARAAEKRDAADQTAEAGLAEADATEERLTAETAERAEKTARIRKDKVDEKADAVVDDAEQRTDRAEADADRIRESAREKAEAGLDDARDAKAEAEGNRADAERLEDLTEAKKAERKRS